MAIEFNYYNYKRRNQLRYEADIDLSGLNVKANPTTAFTDQTTGDVSETNLDEIKDEKVNFVYTGAFNDRLNDNGAEQGSSQSKFLPAYLFDDSLSPTSLDGKAPKYTSGEVLVDTQTIDYRDESKKAIVVSEGSSTESIDPTFYNVRIQPRHELMRSDFPDSYTNKSSVTFDVDTLAILNLWSNSNNAKDGSSSGYISRKEFYRRVTTLQELLGGQNIGLEIVEYPKDLTEDGEDLNASGLTRSSTISESETESSAFVNRKVLEGDELLAPLSDSDITPFTMSVKEGFRGWFDSKEELYSEYLQRVLSLKDEITSFSFASVFIDEEQLNKFGYKKTEFDPPKNRFSGIVIGQDEEGNDIVISRAAYNRKTSKYESTFTSVSPSGKVYAYQVINGVDDNGNARPEFLLVNDSKIFMRNLEFDGTPLEVIENLLDARSDLVAGIAATTAVGTLALGGGGFLAAAGALFVSQTAVVVDEMEDLLERIKRYEENTNESIFPDNIGDEASKYFFTTNSAGITPKTFFEFKYDKYVSRVLVPVDFGFKRSKVRRKLFGFSYTDYVYEDLGVRWIYVSLIDASPFESYRRNRAPSGKNNFIQSNITEWSLTKSVGNVGVTGVLKLEDEIDFESFDMKVGDVGYVHVVNALPLELNGYWQYTIVDENTLDVILDSNSPTVAIEEDGYYGIASSLITPYEQTQPDDDNTPVRIEYNIPYLPDDNTLRQLSFESYGPFDQSEFAVRTRSGGGTTPVLQKDGSIVNVPDDDIPAGWEIFPDTSKEVQDMRSGIDIYNKVNFLLKILKAEFGDSRVKLIETTRSLQDQNNVQLGGPSSNFLSWHNYGLAARIIITTDSGVERIEDGSDDFFKLLDIAEAFTEGAINGDYGEPCTVVWCSRLVAGSDMFDWEFLPIGVGHKDAWKFRDAAYSQQDPYYANAYVNVTRQVEGTSAVTVLEADERPPQTGAYIFKNSKAYKEGVVINNEVYVNPNLIPRYVIPSNLVLKDLQEFLYLIQNRQDANGTDIGGKRTPDEWKSKNPRSFEQLVQYYGMIGNFSSARTLISGDYVRRFEQLVTAISNQDPVMFVKAYLGDFEYNQIKIIPEDAGDSSYISLATGLYVTPVLQIRSIQPEGNGNTFGQEQVDFDTVEFGQYNEGEFIPEDSNEIQPIVTSEPVLSGYEQDDEGNITIDGGDAFILHSLVADQIVESFNEVKNNWLNIDFKLMHDRITESPNARVIPVLENEFGTIMSQDLLSFNQLREMYQRIAINSKKRYVDSGVLGVGVDIENPENESVFEKLVSNAQLSGIRKVNISNETLVEEEPIRQIDVEKVVDEINRKNTPNVRDIL